MNAAGATATVTATGVSPFAAAAGIDAKVATIRQLSDGQFVITAVAAGTTKVTISDANGRSAVVNITVTTTTIPVQ